jgi:hypothetical protein
MTQSLALSFGTLSSAPSVLAALIAECLLVSLRMWVRAARLDLSRQVFTLLDGTILMLGLLFVILVALRFVTVG